MPNKSPLERFLDDPKNRRLLAEEELIVDTSELLALMLERSGCSRAELASRLGKSKSYVTQLLKGGGNPTLRTIAQVFDALDHKAVIRSVPIDWAFTDSSYSSTWNLEGTEPCIEGLRQRYEKTDNPKVVSLLTTAA